MLSIPRLLAAAIRDNPIQPSWTSAIPAQHELWDSSKPVHKPPPKHYFQLLSSLGRSKKSCVYSTDFISWGLPLLSGNSFWFLKNFLYFAKPSNTRLLPAEKTLSYQKHSAGRLQSHEMLFLKPTAFILLEISQEKRQGATARFKCSWWSVCSGLFWKEDLCYLSIAGLLRIKSPLYRELPALPAQSQQQQAAVPASPLPASTVAGQLRHSFPAGLPLPKMSKLIETLRDSEIRAINRNKLLQYLTAVPG